MYHGYNSTEIIEHPLSVRIPEPCGFPGQSAWALSCINTQHAELGDRAQLLQHGTPV